MRLLANENFPGIAVQMLRERGHDVVWVRTDAPGSPDTAVLDKAQSEGRIVVTFDKDFGELAFRRGLPSRCGIILFRFALVSPEAVLKKIIESLESRSDWAGNFAVVEESRVRIRPLNPPADPAPD